MKREPVGGALLLVGTFTAGWVVVLVLVSVIAALAMVIEVSTGPGTGDLGADLIRAAESGQVPPWTLVTTLIVQFPLMLALVPFAHFVADRAHYRPKGQTLRPEGWRAVFAWGPAHPGHVALAVGMGLTVGLLPAWWAELLRATFPFLRNGTLEAIAEVFTSAPWPVQVVFAVQVVAGAAIVEELVFRGFLWDALGRVVPPWTVWVLTSVVFGLYHMDPVQSSAVIVTGFALGWVRWVSGSIWPAMALHATNNALGVFTMVYEVDVEPTLPVAVVTFAVSCAFGAGAWALQRRLDATAHRNGAVGG